LLPLAGIRRRQATWKNMHMAGVPN
jgi:hypothetical protein